MQTGKSGFFRKSFNNEYSFMKRDIIVIPNSKKSEVKENGILIVKVKSKPENNKANSEVVKVLSKHFGKKIKIIKGFKSKRKSIEIY